MMDIRPLERRDWDRVRSIYVQGIATGHATFETETPNWEDWERSHMEACRLVGAAR